eukprot:238283_1
MTTQIEGFTPQSNDELPVVTTTNISSAKQARKPPSSNNALDMYDEEDDRLCRNPTDDPSEDDDDQKNDIPDERRRPSKTKTPRALKMESLLKANDLMDLYEVLNDKNLGIDDLIEIEQDGVNEFCKEIGLSVTQKLKFKRLMRIIRSNQALQQTSSVNTKPSETQQQSDPGACTSTPIGIKECVMCSLCTFHNPYTATICQMCGNSFVSGENDTPLTPGSQHQTFTPGVDDMKESQYGNVTASQKQTEAPPPTAGCLDSDLEDILKTNNLYDDLYTILRDNQFGLEDMKVMKEPDVDEFCQLNQLSLQQKLKFRRLIKALHDTADPQTPSQPSVAIIPINETKQSEEDQFYAEAQAKKKSEKSHRSATLKPDDKMTVLLIGDTHAGKTSLFRNFIGDEFEAKQTSTIGIDSKITVETLAGTNMEVHVFDTAGQARWQAACRPYYKRADCIFVCFAIDDEDALENIWLWQKAIKEYAPDEVIVMLVGCKIDLIQATANDEDSIPTNREEKESKEFEPSKMNRKSAKNMVKVPKWKQFNTTYWECSSRTGSSVEVLFLSAIQAVMEFRNPEPKPRPNPRNANQSGGLPQIRMQLVGDDGIKSSLMRNFTGNKFHTVNADDPNFTVATYSNSAHGKRIDVLDVCVSAISAKDKVSDCVFLCLPMDKPNVLDSVSRWSRQQDLIVILIGYLTQKSQNGSNITSDVYQKNMHSAFQLASQRNVSVLEYTSETSQVAELLFEHATREVLRLRKHKLRKDKLKKNRNDTPNSNRNRSRQKQNRSQNIVLHDPKYAMSNSTGKKKGKGKCCS